MLPWQESLRWTNVGNFALSLYGLCWRQALPLRLFRSLYQKQKRRSGN
jgi:hypothetical protein